MMILPLADALQNCLQNLTSRIAGVDNEQMTGRVMGMGAMLGFSMGAIKEQFKTPSSNNINGSSNTDSSAGGLKGFVNRAKSVINPSMNLSDEKDYNGNVNPIRNVVQTSKVNNSNSNNQNLISNANSVNSSNSSSAKKYTPTSVAKGIAKTGFNATKTYLDIGAKMAEGDFSKSPYNYKSKGTTNNRNNKFQNTEYISKIANNKEIEKLGDDNEFKGKS